MTINLFQQNYLCLRPNRTRDASFCIVRPQHHQGRSRPATGDTDQSPLRQPGSGLPIGRSTHGHASSPNRRCPSASPSACRRCPPVAMRSCCAERSQDSVAGSLFTRADRGGGPAGRARTAARVSSRPRRSCSYPACPPLCLEIARERMLHVRIRENGKMDSVERVDTNYGSYTYIDTRSSLGCSRPIRTTRRRCRLLQS